MGEGDQFIAAPGEEAVKAGVCSCSGEMELRPGDSDLLHVVEEGGNTVQSPEVGSGAVLSGQWRRPKGLQGGQQGWRLRCPST